MLRRTDWKTAAKYAAGITILAIAIAIALVLPQWYGSWQDERMMETVHLESRENIEFMDTGTLDIAGRMKLLAEAEMLGWEPYTELFPEEEQGQEQLMERLKSQLTTWSQCGLIPSEFLQWIHVEHGVALTSYVYADQAAFRVVIYAFVYEKNYMLVIADAEMDLVYYITYSGDLGEQHVASLFGYSDKYEMTFMLEMGIMPELVKQDETVYDFAEVCGAQSSVIHNGERLAELDAELKFENFTGAAFRRIVVTEYGGGIAVMLGTDKWEDVIYMLAGYYGLWIEEVDLYQELEAAWTESGILGSGAVTYPEDAESVYDGKAYAEKE